MDVMQFADLIQGHIIQMYPDAQFYELTEEDHIQIEELVRIKYSPWDWNFGNSPD